jgi:assimilatory nitrate reductase catalytic subunit
MLAAHMDIENPEHRQNVQKFWQSPTIASQPGAKAVEMFDKILNGDIKAVWIMATNPMVSLPNRKKIQSALEKCPLVIVADCVVDNDTLAFADIKLPATTWLEKNGTVTNSERRISRQRAIVPAPGEARHDWQIISSVAKAMGFADFDYLHPVEIFNEHAALSGIKNNGSRLFDISALSQLSQAQYDQLKPVQWPLNSTKKLFSDGLFSTLNKKANFVSINLTKPQYLDDESFPLTLNTGRVRDHWHSMTRTAKAEVLNQHSQLPVLAVHPDDAKKYQITETKLCQVNSLFGGVIVPIKLDNTMRQGDVFLPIHWNQQFASQANVTALYSSAVDPVSGQPQSKQIGVAIKAVESNCYLNCYLDNKEFSSRNKENFLEQLQKSPELISWYKIPGEKYSCIQIALTTQPDDLLSWCQQKLAKGEWLSYSEQKTKRIARVNNHQLSLMITVTDEFQENELDWFKLNLEKESLSFEDISLLLSGEKSEEFNLGRQVCSCFNIREKTINAAIDSGYKSVALLSEKLKCGTNCGSCKPELTKIVNQKLNNSALSEPIESLTEKPKNPVKLT